MTPQRKQSTNVPVEPIQATYLFRSNFYDIKQWAFDWTDQHPGPKGYNDCFCLVFVNQGRFLVDLATQPYDLHAGHVVVEKANYEYQLRPAAGICTIFNFSNAFYEQLLEDYSLRHSFFFGNPNLLTLMLTTTPAVDYLHYQLWQNGTLMGQLERDQLVLDLVQQVIERLENHSLTESLLPSYKRFHLTAIEQAKSYLNSQFTHDISLLALADHCCVSPFHLSRLFKAYTGYAPHQYLISLRLTHAKRLLRDTYLPVTDVGIASGFNSLEHFATAFRQRYKLSPMQYRKETSQGG